MSYCFQTSLETLVLTLFCFGWQRIYFWMVLGSVMFFFFGYVLHFGFTNTFFDLIFPEQKSFIHKENVLALFLLAPILLSVVAILFDCLSILITKFYQFVLGSNRLCMSFCFLWQVWQHCLFTYFSCFHSDAEGFKWLVPYSSEHDV